MPIVGLGVYDIPDKETQRVVEEAISVGYRSIDTAAMYHNERGVGDAVRACGVAREELFVTTKICEPCYTCDETMRTVEDSMNRLKLDYVDLMLLHWPVGNPAVMWKTLEKLYQERVFRAIGVSNFYPNTFPEIVEGAQVMPVVKTVKRSFFIRNQLLCLFNISIDVIMPCTCIQNRLVFCQGVFFSINHNPFP